MKFLNTFHVSLLDKYVHESNHMIDWNVVEVELEGDLMEEPLYVSYTRG